MDDFFLFSKKSGIGVILGPHYCGIGATIRISQEMLCLPYAKFLLFKIMLVYFFLSGNGGGNSQFASIDSKM